MGGKVRQFVAARKLRDSATKQGLNQKAGKQEGGGGTGEGTSGNHPVCLPRPARHERGEGWGRGAGHHARAPTRPSPPSDGGEGVHRGDLRGSAQIRPSARLRTGEFIAGGREGGHSCPPTSALARAVGFIEVRAIRDQRVKQASQPRSGEGTSGNHPVCLPRPARHERGEGGGEGQAITQGRQLSPALSPIGWRRGSPPGGSLGLCPDTPGVKLPRTGLALFPEQDDVTG